MQKELVELTEQEHSFVEALIENDGNLYQAAKEAGYNPNYAYKLRDRLTKAITQAAQEYLALNSIRAAKKIVDLVDNNEPMVNAALNLSAAQSLLDRVGIVKHDPNAPDKLAPAVIKANIFILPEKKFSEAIEVEYQEA